MLIAGLSLTFQVAVYVLILFYSGFKFYFPLFGDMVILIMSLKQLEARIKLNRNMYMQY